MKQAAQLAYQKKIIKEEYVKEQDINQRMEALKEPKKK